MLPVAMTRGLFARGGEAESALRLMRRRHFQTRADASRRAATAIFEEETGAIAVGPLPVETSVDPPSGAAPPESSGAKNRHRCVHLREQGLIAGEAPLASADHSGDVPLALQPQRCSNAA